MEPGEQVGSLGFWWLLLVRNSGEWFLKRTEPLSVAPSSVQCTAHWTKPFLKSRFSFGNLKMKIKKGTSPTGSKWTLNSPLQPEL